MCILAFSYTFTSATKPLTGSDDAQLRLSLPNQLQVVLSALICMVKIPSLGVRGKAICLSVVCRLWTQKLPYFEI
jgi:hypothetical protein